MERIIDRFDKYMKLRDLNDNKVTEQLSLSIGLIGKSRKEGRDLSRNVVDSILDFYTDIEKVWFLTGEGNILKFSKRGLEVKKVINNSGFDLNDVATGLDIEDIVLQDWLTKISISNETLEKISKAININSFLFQVNARDLGNAEDFFANYMDRIAPYYPDVNASAGLDFLTNNGHNYSIPIRIPNVDAQAYINVFGDSMYPKYCNGEIIGIKEIQADMVFFGHAYVVNMIDGEAYIKYIDPGKDDEHWILRSENPNYKPKQFHLSKIHKVFVIKAVITKSTIL